MKTFMEKPENVERKWFIIDAANVPLGRIASQAANVLMGKHKPTYTPHVDSGDFVIVINSDKVVLTGKKPVQKIYRTHSGYVGGLKETDYKTLLANKSDLAIEHAIKGMLPKNSLGKHMAVRLKVFKGAEHNHQAQQPQVLEIKGAKA